MIIPSKNAERQDRPPDTNLVPDSFKDDYVQGALKPFLLSGIYQGERPVLPMIDLTLSKEAAIPAHIFGMLYDSWKPNVEEEGTSVFLQGYGNRGPNNERKKIYYSALTPDLYGPMYAEKIKRLLDQLFDEQNVDKPLMQQYYQSNSDNYFDMYWDLHLGVRGDDIPDEIREIGERFMNVIGYWYPTLQVVHDNYMRVRELRPRLKDWIRDRVRDLTEGKIPNPEKTFVYYWDKNRGQGKNFKNKDIIFECFHNFLAFSQWGNTLYNIMKDLDAVTGEPSVRSWFEKTMTSGPDEMDNSPFPPLDRFVMELFRTISPNGGSVSSLGAIAQFFGAGYTGFSTIITPHPETSTAPHHWNKPHDFDPDRYKTATTSEQNDETTCKEVGLAQCPFSKEDFSVKDGRQADLTNSAFGAVYGVIDGEAYPVCDDAGYAPFGFGYRRCPGEFLTVDFVKDLLRKVWAEKIEFRRLNIADAKPLPVAPNMVVKDDIGFKKEQ